MEQFKIIIEYFCDIIIIVYAVLYMLQPLKSKKKSHIGFAICTGSFLIVFTITKVLPLNVEKVLDGKYIYVLFLVSMMVLSLSSLVFGLFMNFKEKKETNQSLQMDAAKRRQ